MSNRKHRDSQQIHSENAAESSKPEPQATTQSGPQKSAGKMMLFLWGIPLTLFVVIAVIKQCG